MQCSGHADKSRGRGCGTGVGTPGTLEDMTGLAGVLEGRGCPARDSLSSNHV